MVGRHEGAVTAQLADAVTATFGLPSLHEDDALRAVRAAVDLREQLAEHHELAPRIGIATGEVVASGPSMPVGAVAGSAVRLANGAEPSEIVLDDATRRLVANAVDVEPSRAARLPPAGAASRCAAVCAAARSAAHRKAGRARRARGGLRQRGRATEAGTPRCGGTAGDREVEARGRAVAGGRRSGDGAGRTLPLLRAGHHALAAPRDGPRSSRRRDTRGPRQAAPERARRPGGRRADRGRARPRGRRPTCGRDSLGISPPLRDAGPIATARPRRRGRTLGRAGPARPARLRHPGRHRRAAADPVPRAPGALRGASGLGNGRDRAGAALVRGHRGADRQPARRIEPEPRPAQPGRRARGGQSALRRAVRRAARRRRRRSASLRLRRRFTRSSPPASTVSARASAPSPSGRPSSGASSRSRRSQGSFPPRRPRQPGGTSTR